MNNFNGNAKAERLISFQKKVIHHPALTEAFSKLDMTVKNPARNPLSIVFGPTGVGKTTLVQKLEEKLYEHFRAEMDQDPGMIAVCRVEAPAPDSGRFHWRDMWIRMLESMHEPQITKKLPKDVTEKALVRTEKDIRQEAKGVSGPDVRRALEHCLKYRRTRVIIIDEAQHLKKAPNSRQMLDSMDTIKSLASLAGVFLVLVGTYELLDMLSLNGQLARRTSHVHFPRYRGDDSEQLHAFKSVVSTFQKALPFSEPSDLLNNYEYLYQGSLGCVGILKSWLDRAVSQAIDSDKRTLQLPTLKQTALDHFALARIAKELSEAEQHRIWNGSNTTGFSSRSTSMTDNGHGATNGSKNGNTRPGERKPTRDKIGTDQNDNLPNN